ncbi:MAG: Holliday junction resolvase RuvX [Rhodocyclaceae bacterium]|nr:Holliday junction resolvase RuvX [Rhodocyclaceae bacterium]
MPDGSAGHAAGAAAGDLVLAFDFGTERIGVAVGATMLKNARPLATISAAANAVRFDAIGRLIAEWQPARLVVGLPLALDGSEHDMTARCRRFAQQLHGRFRLPVEFADERLSSAAAESRLRARGHDLRRGKAAVDAEAAAIILQSYFDRTHHADPARSS